MHDADGRPTRWSLIVGMIASAIIDISDPDQPDIVSSARNGTSFALDAPQRLDIALIGEHQYAMVATDESQIPGLQMINVTDPLQPTAGGAVLGQQGDDFDLIDVIGDVSAMQIGSRHYALVASINVNGSSGSIVIVDVTDPDSLSPCLERAHGFGHTCRLQVCI